MYVCMCVYVQVVVIRDGLVEETEVLTLSIEPIATETGVIIQQSSVDIMIEDKDGE